MYNLKKDLPAGLVVFLVALPLCLGVALASGAPLLSGLIAGIIGGIVVGLLSDSQTSVSGPAAGLAAVVLTSITDLGSFNTFLLAVVVAGVIQLIAGWMKIGVIADYIPSNIIKGLLAAIGIILILKQIPHAVGFDDNAEGDFAFHQPDGGTTFSTLAHIQSHFSMGAIIIALLSLFVLIYWPKTPLSKIKFLPSSLFVVFIGIGLNSLFLNFVPSLAINTKHLVQIPPFDFRNMGNLFQFPDFSQIANIEVWFVGLTIAIVASLETLLNLEAVDNIDPHKRRSSPNRELIAQGIGNSLAGLVGGIPITSVIVRSSVNIDAGNASKLSAIIHGFFLILSIVVLGPVLNQIPLASLAAILLITGYKLAKVSLFTDMYKEGWVQFIPFATTVVAIILTDLLIGIFIGSAVSVFFVMRSIYRNPFSIQNHKVTKHETIRIELPSQVSFFNKPTIKNTLWNIPENSRVIIDASETDYIEHDILEIINDFKEVAAPEKNIKLNIIGLRSKYQYDDHIQFLDVMDAEMQENITPQQVLETLKQGNERFIHGKSIKKYYKQQALASTQGQYPIAVVVGCIDSRTSPEILFDANLGDILTIRNAGNVVSDGVIGSLEIACIKIGAKLIMIKGHEDCGAVKLSLLQPFNNNMDLITNQIRDSFKLSKYDPSTLTLDTISQETLKDLTWANVHHTIELILEKSELLRKKVESGEIEIVGAYHEISTGRVQFDR